MDSSEMSLSWQDENAPIMGLYDRFKFVQYKRAAAADANEAGDEIIVIKIRNDGGVLDRSPK